LQSVGSCAGPALIGEAGKRNIFYFLNRAFSNDAEATNQQNAQLNI
jgi:hypothetical protein